MEQIQISLSELTFGQKLNLMESIWDDLTKDEKKLESPHWHKDILIDREIALKAGKVKMRDWDESKERILKKVK